MPLKAQQLGAALKSTTGAYGGALTGIMSHNVTPDRRNMEPT